jgi:hypothetical protein
MDHCHQRLRDAFGVGVLDHIAIIDDARRTLSQQALRSLTRPPPGTSTRMPEAASMTLR